MSGLLERTAGYFLAPAPPVAAPVVSAAVLRRAAVLGAGRDARAMAAAVAMELRRAAGAPAACAAVWAPVAQGLPGEGVSAETPGDVSAETPGDVSAETPPAAPSLAALGAARLVARLGGQGFDAAARGRIAWVALPDAPAQAAAGWERLANRIDAPAVLVVAGPRACAFEPALAELETVVVVTPRDADPLLGELALASLAGPRVVAVPPLAAAARVVALSGIGRVAVARELADAVRA